MKVDGHATFSGIAVVVVVVSVESDEAPLRRGMVKRGRRKVAELRKRARAGAAKVIDRVLNIASVCGV